MSWTDLVQLPAWIALAACGSSHPTTSLDAASDGAGSGGRDGAPTDAASCTPTAWQLTPLGTGDNPAIAMGPDGTLHVLYVTSRTGGDVRHGSIAPDGTWTTDLVYGEQSTTNTALTVDADGGLHAAFEVLATSTYSFRYGYAAPGTTTWITQLVYPVGFAGDQIVSIASDTADQPHIAYMYPTPTIKVGHAHRDSGGTWITDPVETIGATITGGPRIALHGATIQLVYPANNSPMRFASGGPPFTLSSLPAASATVALATDGSGTPHVVYDEASGTVGHLISASRDANGMWTTETAAMAGAAPETCASRCFPAYSSSLALDRDGGRHASFAEVDEASISSYQVLQRYAYRSPAGTWTNEYIDGQGAYAGNTNAIAIDPLGGIHVVYTVRATPTGTAQLMHAYRCH